MKGLIDRLLNGRMQHAEEGPPEANRISALGDDVRELIYNRRRVAYGILCRELASALEQAQLQRNGGLLFQALLEPPGFHFGMLPAYIEGERGYHYDIHLKVRDACTLIGTVSPARELTLLFKVPEPDDAQRRKLHATYQAVARLLLDAAAEPVIPDEITLGVVRDYAIYASVPDDMSGMARLE